MNVLYTLNLNLGPMVRTLNSQKRFSTTLAQDLISSFYSCRGFNNHTCVGRHLLNQINQHNLNPRSINRLFSSSRSFSTLSNPTQVSVEKLSLYEQTARPLENLKVDARLSKDTGGMKSCRLFDNPNVVRVRRGEKETLGDKLYRYMDVGGFFSMLNSRKVHLLRVRAEGRASLMCFTEFERKQSLFMKAVLSLLLYYVYFCYVKHKLHIFDRHPSPELPTFEFTNNKTKDFTWHGSLPFQYPKGRCKECRWLELECKKRCYDDLLNQGHEFILQNPMQVPRRHLLPSPYPPAD